MTCSPSRRPPSPAAQTVISDMPMEKCPRRREPADGGIRPVRRDDSRCPPCHARPRLLCVDVQDRHNRYLTELVDELCHAPREVVCGDGAPV
jgi:hypothetical protein